MTAFSFAAFAFALTLQPAAPDAGLDCARASVSAAEREAMADALSGNGEALPGDVGQRLRACGESAGHDENTGPGYMATVFAALAGETLRERLAARDIDPVLIDAWYAGQDEATRIEYPDQATSERMVTDLIAAGVPVAALEAHGTMVGNYLATLLIPERIARGLPPR